MVLVMIGLCSLLSISAQDDALVIRPGKKPRAGWAVAFRKMAERGASSMAFRANSTARLTLPARSAALATRSWARASPGLPAHTLA